MYFGTGSPGPAAGTERHPWGTSRPGPNLYTSSIVKLDAKSGKLEWHYQFSPHALCDWDVESNPILLKAGRRDLVIAGSKSGVVVALDRDTGNLVWKRPVGIHNGHDNDGLDAMRGDFSNLKLPMTVYPGSLGGVATPPSTDGSSVFLSVVNYATVLSAQNRGAPTGSMAGELVALDGRTGAVQWKRKFASMPFGTTTVNDLVFVTTLDGAIHAFDVDNGEKAWNASLPTGITSSVSVSGDTLLAPAGFARSSEEPAILAYRLPS